MRANPARLLHVAALVILFTGNTLARGCDAVSAFERILNDQGLMLLRPARDTVKLGGIFVQASNGKLQYWDPPAPPPQSESPSFSAAIYGETSERTSTLGSAASLGKALIALPSDLSYQHEQEVELSQINASGVRLTTEDVERFANTSGVIAVLADWLRAKKRVYVVQEVFAATSVSITARGQQDLRVSVAKAALPACDKSTSAGSSDRTSTTPSTQAATETTAGEQSNGVQLCEASRSSLTLKTDRPLPFAVRPIELKLTEPRSTRTGPIVLAPPGTIPRAGRINVPDRPFRIRLTTRTANGRIGSGRALTDFEPMGRFDALRILQQQ